VKSTFLLDVVIRKSSAILELFSSKDQPLLIWGNSLLVLDLGLHVFNSIRGFYLQCNGFAGQSLDKDLHTSTKTKHEVKCTLFLDVVIRQGSAILQLFTSKDQPLLIWGNSFLILNLGLDILDCVRRLHLQCDCFACEGLHEDLHTSTQSKDKMKSTLLLDVVIRQSSAVFQLFTSEDQPLLVWRNSLFILDLSFDILDGI